MSDDAATQLIVQIDGESISERRLQAMTMSLKGELTAIRPVALELKRDASVPEGAMAVEAFTAGALIIAVLPAMLPALIEYLRDWSLRNADRTITVRRRVGENEVEVTIPADLPNARVAELVDLLSAKVEPPAGSL